MTAGSSPWTEFEALVAEMEELQRKKSSSWHAASSPGSPSRTFATPTTFPSSTTTIGTTKTGCSRGSKVCCRPSAPSTALGPGRGHEPQEKQRRPRFSLRQTAGAQRQTPGRGGRKKGCGETGRRKNFGVEPFWEFGCELFLETCGAVVDVVGCVLATRLRIAGERASACRRPRRTHGLPSAHGRCDAPQ